MILALLVTIGFFDLVPEAECNLAADKVVSGYHENALLSGKLTFHDARGRTNVRAYVYELSPASLDVSLTCDEDEERWGVDRYVTVIVGAHYEQSPVMEISNALPAWIANLQKAVERASSLWPGLAPRLTGYIYLAPLDEWFEFTTSQGKRYLGAYDMREYELEKLTPVSSQDAWLSSLGPHSGWARIASGGFFLASEKKIANVPYALWSYGCSPTASSMILDYWDRRGYPKLVDYYFDRWDNVEQENDKDLTNVHRELAIGMHTDSMNRGSTSILNITTGNLYAANSVNGYSFTGSTVMGGNSTVYGAVIGEINAGRPVHWAVGNYDYAGERINHSVCAVGYEITSTNDSLVVLHNTWDKAEHRWPYETPGASTEAFPMIPGGAQSEDLRLTCFTTASVLYKGIKYAATFEKAGSLNEIKMWSAMDDDKNGWDQLASSSGTESYALIEMSDDLVGARINVEGYSGGTLKAADGTVSRLVAMDFPANPHFTLKGHVPAYGSSSARVVLNENVAYVSQGSAGLRVVKLANDYLAVTKNLTSHAAEAVARDGDWLYVLGGNTLYLYDVSSLLAPAFRDSVPLTQTYGAFAVHDGRAYLGRVGSEIEVYRKDGTKLLGDVPLPETLVTGLDVISGKLYVSAYRNGVNVYDLSSGSAQFERNVPTKGGARGVARSGDILYVAEGGTGVEAIDLVSGSTNVFDPGSVYNLISSGDRLYLACGQSGLVVCKPGPGLTLEKLGELIPPSGSVESAALGGGRVYLGAGFDGFMAFACDLTGVAEEPLPAAQPFDVKLASFPRPGASPGKIRLDVSGSVAVRLYDVTGRQVMHSSGEFTPGTHALPLLPRGLSRGVYFLEVNIGASSSTGKVVVLD